VLTLPGGVHDVGPDLDLSIEHKSKARYASPQYPLGNKAYAKRAFIIESLVVCIHRAR